MPLSLSLRRFATILFVVLCLWSASSSGYAADRSIRGLVTDDSKGVLPGVTVTARSAGGEVLATVVTDGTGRYVVGPLAAGPVILTFYLEGFAPVVVRVAVGAEADVVADQRLVVAPQSETVNVVGRVPAPRPLPPPPPRPVPRPKPVTIAVPEHDRDSVCGPAKLGAVAESYGTIQSRRYAANALYGAGDELVVDAGTIGGLVVGGNFVVRRSYRIEWDPNTEIAEHTAGLVQIVSAEEFSSVAVVIYACDEMLQGDRLASFHPEPLRAALPAGTPDYRNAAKVLFPDIGQMLGAPRRMMVIDRGINSGVRVGQRVTLFRRRLSDGATTDVGDAVVVNVRVDSATIRVDHVTDAIFSGDLAALHTAK